MSTSANARRSKRVVASESSETSGDTPSAGPVGFGGSQRRDLSPSAPRKKALVQPASSGSIRLRLKVAPQIGPSGAPQVGPRPKSARIEAVGEKRTSVQNDWDITPPEKKRIRRSVHVRSSTPGEMQGSTFARAEQRSSTPPSPPASSPPSSEAGTDDLDGPTDLGQAQAIDRMTARQRSKHDASYVEQLMVLREDNSKKMVLTEQERTRRKEETARRRKLQADQRQENDKREAIDRLLKAQTGKGRSSKDDNTLRDGTGPITPGSVVERRPAGPCELRYVSSISSEEVRLRLGVVDGVLPPTDWLPISSRPRPKHCAVPDCKQLFKYRLVNHPQVGACSLGHLQTLEQR